jgi:hypothetical protein
MRRWPLHMGVLTPTVLSSAHSMWSGVGVMQICFVHIYYRPAFLAVLSYCSEVDHSNGSNITAFYIYLSVVSSFLPSKRNVCGKIIQKFLNINKSCSD